MEAVKTLLRLFSYVFDGLLALFLIAVSGFALASGGPDLHLDMLPWTGSTLIWVVLAGSLFGLISVLLAMVSKWRFLFFLWSLAVAVLLIRGYVFTSYHFQQGGVSTAIGLTVASLLALLGAWFQLFRRRERPGRY
ncbi:MAG TPA: hypothetical protein VME43_20735 [Bryobacteraceae bacterium]|nr:hypothetical protein [Bryobacteraceae bacterium]